ESGGLCGCANRLRGDALIRFSVKFYLIAMLFLIFDLEVVFLYPWAIYFRQLGIFGLVQMGIFLGILTIGFIYVWKKGALDWDLPNRGNPFSTSHDPAEIGVKNY